MFIRNFQLLVAQKNGPILSLTLGKGLTFQPSLAEKKRSKIYTNLNEFVMISGQSGVGDGALVVDPDRVQIFTDVTHVQSLSQSTSTAE